MYRVPVLTENTCNVVSFVRSHMINTFLLVYQMGTCCVYVVFISSNLKMVSNAFGAYMLSARDFQLGFRFQNATTMCRSSDTRHAYAYAYASGVSETVR